MSERHRAQWYGDWSSPDEAWSVPGDGEERATDACWGSPPVASAGSGVGADSSRSAGGVSAGMARHPVQPQAGGSCSSGCASGCRTSLSRLGTRRGPGAGAGFASGGGEDASVAEEGSGEGSR